jgi:Leucine-rich repeat (LRR) protein
LKKEKTIPNPDSAEYLKWAIKLEYDSDDITKDPSKAFAEAQSRIQLESTEQTSKLDLGGLYLKTIPETIIKLKHLKILRLGGIDFEGDTFPLAEIAPVNQLESLTHLILHGRNIQSINNLSQLTQLRYLNLNYTAFDDLSELSNLTELKHLILVGTKVQHITGLDKLTRLQ